MQIRLIEPGDAEIVHAFRLEALLANPEAFGSTYEETTIMPPEVVLARSQCTDENFKVGAFSDDRIVGTAGFVRSTRVKTRHRGDIFGMYVAADFRGQGVGKAVLQDLIARASRLDGLEQITLDVMLPNPRAQELYRGLGFEVFGLHRNGMKTGDVYHDIEQRILHVK